MSDDPRIDPADLRNVRFPGSSRRYDARSVDQFLETVAARITATNTLVEELRSQLFDARSAPDTPPPPPAPVLAELDEDELVRLVGEETTTVLSAARRAAEEIRSKAEESAARVIREATAEADRVVEEAQARRVELTAEAEQALERATTEAEAEAARLVQEATELAERATAEREAADAAQQAELEARRAEAEAEVSEILAAARDEGRGMVAEAREVRARILDDLQRRRDIARDHIERLLAGRERLLAAYGQVRENLDDITAQLADALPDPGEPELPDGFVGVVGSTGSDADRDGGGDGDGDGDGETSEGPGPAAEAPAEEGLADDTVPPAAEEDAPGEDQVEEDEAPVAEDAAPEPEHQAEPEPEPEPQAAPEPEPEPQAAPEPEPVEPTELEADRAEAEAPQVPDDLDPADVPTEEPAGDVDALFARLRAEREESVARAQQVLEPEPEPEPEASVQPDPVTEPEPEAEGGEARGGDVERLPVEFLAPEAELERRTDALVPVAEKLNRALKRRLADEQNELLDLLRRSGTTVADELLPALDVQVEGYAALARRHLAAAATAGGGEGAEVAPLAEALGRAIVEPFRRRLERSAADVDGDADELDERLRALYREWKAQHIGPVTDDALLSAYAAGTLHGAAGAVRWCIDPAQGPCPDAQDNALAGAIDSGEAFPTGDTRPQAHPGCRCLLVPGP